MIRKAGTDYYKGSARQKWELCATASKDGELATTQSGKTIGKVSVKAYEKEDGTAVWMTVTMWGDFARFVGGIRKGTPLLAVGEVNEREYNGKKYFDFNADFVMAMGVGAAASATAPAAVSTSGGVDVAFTEFDGADGELPF